MADNTFVVHSEWLNAISELPRDIQDKIIADFVRYGCRIDTAYDDIPQISSFVKILKGRIDFSIDKYAAKVNNPGPAKSEEAKINRDLLVWEMARRPMTAQEIANQLGCSKSTIDHCLGWKQRNNDEFCNSLQ